MSEGILHCRSGVSIAEWEPLGSSQEANNQFYRARGEGESLLPYPPPTPPPTPSRRSALNDNGLGEVGPQQKEQRGRMKGPHCSHQEAGSWVKRQLTGRRCEGREVTTHTQAPFTWLIRASTDCQNCQPPLPNKQHVGSLCEFQILPDKLGA